MPAPIDLADIQGDILRAYGNRFDRTSYLFVGVGDAARGRAWLRGLMDRVTTAVPWSGPGPEATLNVAFTSAGLVALGVAAETVASFSGEFRDGMAQRAPELGDVGESDPGTWEPGLGTGAAHVLVVLNARSDDALQEALGTLQSESEQHGLTVVHEDHARMLEGSREHFGYADGFSQPAIEGVSDDRAPGGGVPEGDGTWRALALGEFILGYEDEETRLDRRQRRLPRAPLGPLGRSGTYMVWRKLSQDVALFRSQLRASAALYEQGDAELLAAKIVGRWRNGTPLTVSRTAPQPDFDARSAGANDFRYRQLDANGYGCPLGAHIRRSNPRDALGFDGKLSFRHRMIRRGMPYGPSLPDDATADDGQDRGLVFVCFNASISRQFESVQRQWLNDGNAFQMSHDTDFLLGAPAEAMRKMTVQGDPPFFFSPQGPFVTTRGGEYLFVPGITGLAAIADGVAG